MMFGKHDPKLVQAVDKELATLRENMICEKERNAALSEANAKLRLETYKDDELCRMSEELEKMRRDTYRGFPISEEESNAIDEWRERHEQEVHGIEPGEGWKYAGVSGGGYTYIFVPTSIGISGTIRCHCGAEFEFKQID